MKKFDVIYLIISFIISFGLGIIFNDKYLLGSTTLYLGLVQTLLMTKGKWYEQFAGIFCIILSSVVSFLAHMYSSAIFTILVYIPLSIFSMTNWKKHQNNNIVEINKMTIKKSILILFLIIISTISFSSLLSLIPTQRLIFWDAAGDILNISAIILIALRYKEGWIVWILCNFVDITTWCLTLSSSYSNNAIMMIMQSFFYLGCNIWGFNSFIKLRKTQENSQ